MAWDTRGQEASVAIKSLSISLSNSDPGMTWGWLVAMIGIQCVAMSMAELCSSMPTSGGLYYASAVLAPQGYGPFAAWITGWSNWLCQITGAPSVNYGTAAMTLAAASMMVS